MAHALHSRPTEIFICPKCLEFPGKQKSKGETKEIFINFGKPLSRG